MLVPRPRERACAWCVVRCAPRSDHAVWWCGPRAGVVRRGLGEPRRAESAHARVRVRCGPRAQLTALRVQVVGSRSTPIVEPCAPCRPHPHPPTALDRPDYPAAGSPGRSGKKNQAKAKLTKLRPDAIALGSEGESIFLRSRLRKGSRTPGASVDVLLLAKEAVRLLAYETGLRSRVCHRHEAQTMPDTDAYPS